MADLGYTYRGMTRVLLNHGRSRVALFVGIPLVFMVGVQVASFFLTPSRRVRLTTDDERQRIARFISDLIPKKHEFDAAERLKQEADNNIVNIPEGGEDGTRNMVPGIVAADDDGVEIIDLDNVEVLNAPNDEPEGPVEDPLVAAFTPRIQLIYFDRSTERYRNLMELPQPPYLDEFHNPCWVERLFNGAPFRDSYYFDHNDKAHQQYFANREQMWSTYYQSGIRNRLRCLPFVYVIGTPECDAPELFSQLQLSHRLIKGLHRKTDWWGGLRFQYFQKKGHNITRRYVPISHYLDLMDEAAVRITNVVRWTQGKEYHSLVLGESSETALSEMPGWKGLPENAGRPDESGPVFFEANYMRKIQPGAKFIFILKHPSKRLYLEYQHDKAFNHTPDDFHERCMAAVEEMEACLKANLPWACVHNTSITEKNDIQLRRSMYHIYIRRWLEVFPRDQVFIMKTEEFRSDPVRWINKALNFLEFGSLNPTAEKKASVLPERQDFGMKPMHGATRTMLDNFFSVFNKRLSDLLQDKRFLWQ